MLGVVWPLGHCRRSGSGAASGPGQEGIGQEGIGQGGGEGVLPPLPQNQWSQSEIDLI